MIKLVIKNSINFTFFVIRNIQTLQWWQKNCLLVNFYSHTFEYLLQCSEERINPGKLLGKSSRLKYQTRFQKTIGWWSTKSATVIAWSPSFSNKLSSSFHTTKGLRYGTVIGSGLGRCHSNPKESCWINKNHKWQIQDLWY